MVTSFCLIACALTVGQAPDRTEFLLAPQLAPGQEFVYKGAYIEESLIPNVLHKQEYGLDAQIFVLQANKRSWDVAVMSALSLRDSKQEKNPKPNVGPGPTSVRLDLLQVDAQGRLKSPAGAALLVPLQGPPTLECGAFVETPLTKVGKNGFWPVNEEGRPARTWTLLGVESCGGVACVKLIGEQQSDDWDQPRADRAAWRRHDVVWLSTQLGVAQKLERVIERRDAARREPTHRATVRYELESRLKYPGKLYDDRKVEIDKAARFQEEAKPLLAQPAIYGGQIDGLIRKLHFYMENHPPTPYRKVVVQLESRLDKARKGEAPAVVSSDDPEPPRVTLAVGQKVSDFVVTDLISRQSTRLNRLLGKPVLVFFYNPNTPTGKEVLAFACDQAAKHGERLGIMAMAVAEDADFVRKQHADLRLPFHVHDGKGLRFTFGVDATPRLVVLDGEGVIRAAHTGWGFHTPGEISEEIMRCLK
ncbi:MAG: redoxin domain-containing protein [Planctomycetes bacterium]|nr:redoxin domain-containing protein [Planctomycetota bacterium]